MRERKPELCGDDVSMNLMTHATNPLLAAGTINSALAAFDAGRKDDSVDSLFTVNKCQTRFYCADGTPVNHDPGNLIPTQDIEPWYEENSNL
jgi:CMP-N-acetylneuraminic acid synthetase